MELSHLISVYAVLHGLMTCCFIEEEASVADDSRKLDISIGVTEDHTRLCVGSTVRGECARICVVIQQ